MLAVIWCSVCLAVVGWILVMVDHQYEASPVPLRAIIAVLGGMFAIVLGLPITLLVAAAAWLAGWLAWGREAGRP